VPSRPAITTPQSAPTPTSICEKATHSVLPMMIFITGAIKGTTQKVAQNEVKVMISRRRTGGCQPSFSKRQPL
jgi:hypothetical protein